MHLVAFYYKNEIFVVVFTRIRHFPSPKPDEFTPHPSVLHMCSIFSVYSHIKLIYFLDLLSRA
jgi:hypothetical protein